MALLQPTRFDLQWLSVEDALRGYDRSVAFYEELVEREGRQEYADELAEVRAARAALAAQG